MSDIDRAYVGEELDNFAIAANWKDYWASMVRPYMGKRVLEVGAGIGSSTKILSSVAPAEVWLCLEPDARNLASLQAEKEAGNLPEYVEIRRGTLAALHRDEEFDTLLYIDVLEHIEDDRAEIEGTAGHIALGGHLIILAPAYPFLFSEFDEAIGHYRRYTRQMFADGYGGWLMKVGTRYLDSVGLIASISNYLLLRSSLPSKPLLSFWDRFLVPVSRIADRIFQFRFGRSILVVYQRTL